MGKWVAQKQSKPTMSGEPEWWVFDDEAEYKLVAICPGPEAKKNAAFIVAAHNRQP